MKITRKLQSQAFFITNSKLSTSTYETYYYFGQGNRRLYTLSKLSKCVSLTLCGDSEISSETPMILECKCAKLEHAFVFFTPALPGTRGCFKLYTNFLLLILVFSNLKIMIFLTRISRLSSLLELSKLLGHYLIMAQILDEGKGSWDPKE